MAKKPTVPPELRVDDPATSLRWPFSEFFRAEASGGILLIVATVAALAWANSPWRESYDHFWHTYVGISAGSWSLKLSLQHWINDALMAVFFFFVGLEIKREVTTGELRTPKQAALPIMAAIGGMAFPALVFLAVNGTGSGVEGWGIPMATDIAFALGILSLLGPRVPLGLKVFLTALAIVDDLGAVLVIALFYTSGLAVWWLVAGIGLVLVLAVLSRLGVRRIPVYVLVGIVVWYCFLRSGVHATIAGVAVAMTIPSRILVERETFEGIVERALAFLKGKDDRSHSDMERRDVALEAIGAAADRYGSPLHRLEHGLAPWVAFAIMPVFALANAGVAIDPAHLVEAPAGRAIAAGLVLGKTIGITLFSFVAVKLGMCVLPRRVGWSAIVGAAALGGIGFTMSLFIAALAYPDPALLASAKMGILGGSLVAGLLGAALLGIRLKPEPA